MVHLCGFNCNICSLLQAVHNVTVLLRKIIETKIRISDKVVRVRDVKVYKSSRGVTPIIFKLGRSWN
jgi:hypothetical protein